ncbi:MAG: hypothetical protein K0U41_00075 [Gammaproteobacteria bacterium]|nr:hypothetical protein [Gammaproteobacteria bacterium]
MSRREQLADGGDFDIAPNMGFEYLCDFMALAGYYEVGYEGQIRPFNAQEALAQEAYLNVELLESERRIVCWLSRLFVKAVSKYSNNPNAVFTTGD